MFKLNTSGYKGIRYCKDGNRKKKWATTICVDGKKIYLGRYYTKEEAIEVYKQASIKYHKEFSNFLTL